MPDEVAAPDLEAAAAAVDLARAALAQSIKHIAGNGGVEADQSVSYDLAPAAAGIEIGRAVLDYGAKGDVEARIACAFVADAVADLVTRLIGRTAQWGIDPSML